MSGVCQPAAPVPRLRDRRYSSTVRQPVSGRVQQLAHYARELPQGML